MRDPSREVFFDITLARENGVPRFPSL